MNQIFVHSSIVLTYTILIYQNSHSMCLYYKAQEINFINCRINKIEISSNGANELSFINTQTNIFGSGIYKISNIQYFKKLIIVIIKSLLLTQNIFIVIHNSLTKLNCWNVFSTEWHCLTNLVSRFCCSYNLYIITNDLDKYWNTGLI